MRSGAAEPDYAAAYQGAPGAFSEEAALRLLGAGRLLPCARFDEVFDAVAEGRSRLGVVPIENTLAGSVSAVCDLLRERDLRIVAETTRRISHCVMARPGVRLEGVRQVLSHPVALAQCEEFFRRHPRIEPVPVYDTAGAVAQVMAGASLSTAALGSGRAAELYGASILVREVEDQRENFTRFLALAPAGGSVDLTEAATGGGGRKASLVFTLANRPGALHAALAPFAARGLDLTRIESRPLRGRPFEYSFFVDLAGLAGEREERNLDAALAELRLLAQEVKLLGTYAESVPQSRGLSCEDAR